MLLCVVVFSQVGKLTVAAETMTGDNMIWFTHPARHWASEALPIGNGRMGAMLFGGVDHERIQFNEQSLWSGDNNWDGDYKTGDHGFGSYRDFGDITIDWNGATRPAQVTSPSGHTDGDGPGHGIAASVDANPATKWCIADPGSSVMWQATLATAQAVNSYTITSVEDVPSRDPLSWVLEGSDDGKNWIELDRQDLGKPFETRHLVKTFTITKPIRCRTYRLAFTPKDPTHFQLAEISLAGVAFDSSLPTPADYRRVLDITTGVHRTTSTLNGTAVTREAFASHPDQVMVFRYTADTKATFTGRIQMKSAQDAVTISTSKRPCSNTADICSPVARGPVDYPPICRGSGTTATNPPGPATITPTSTSR